MPAEPTGVVEPDGDQRLAADEEDVRATSFLQRATLRRRLRFLRRRRELALRELGDLVFESQRRGGEPAEALSAKLAALEEITAESERLEHALDEHTELLVLRAPGIATCVSCSTLHQSEDRFCPRCGTPAGKTSTR
ncbi:MAG TPA: hypothetical protein VHM72_10230 [Solirubrobacteraceae bacterium]|jgi:rubrerythrin|nr:hypothetical protein [Solirubrobacteraceae bacterium]